MAYYKKHIIMSQISLRLLASLVSLAATLTMGLSKETNDIAGFQMEASYKASPAFKFFLVGNAVACGYSLLTLPFASTLVEGYMLHWLDMMIMSLVMASASAATAIGYLGKKGNDFIGWSQICPYYEKFCDRVAISLLFSYLGFLLFLIICALSVVHKTKNNNNNDNNN